MPSNSRGYIKEYECTLRRLQDIHHSHCIFRIHPPVENLRVFFSEDGTLLGRFVCSAEHQGYDNIVHGGIIAALIDASMAQCCMGARDSCLHCGFVDTLPKPCQDRYSGFIRNKNSREKARRNFFIRMPYQAERTAACGGKRSLLQGA